MRPQAIWGFAAGLAIGSIVVAAAAFFGSAEAQQLPACETITFASIR